MPRSDIFNRDIHCDEILPHSGITDVYDATAWYDKKESCHEVTLHF